jgi:hypothetical protein
MIDRVRRWLLLAVVVLAAAVVAAMAPSTTTANGATFAYDVPTIARVDVHEFEAGAISPSGVREGSVSPSAAAQGTSTISTHALVATEAGDIAGANFAQTTASRTFSSGGTFAGQSIDDVAGALRSGAMSAKDVPVQVIVRDGNTLILNTRSALALEQAGVPRSAWNVVNVTGDPAAQARLAGQLARNGLDSTGTSSVRITGAG